MDNTEAIRNMVDNILNNKEADAMEDFNTAVAIKLTDALDNRKQELASALGQTPQTEEEYEDEEV